MDGKNEDWASASVEYDSLISALDSADLAKASEAQTRFDVIDRMIREVLGWKYGNIKVEVVSKGPRKGFVDYILSVGDATVVIEAKKAGASFPNPTKRRRLKLSGSVLGSGVINRAIEQADTYADGKNADLVCVTNGFCWCYYLTSTKNTESYAT